MEIRGDQTGKCTTDFPLNHTDLKTCQTGLKISQDLGESFIKCICDDSFRFTPVLK
jgi:hypothetical protein